MIGGDEDDWEDEADWEEWDQDDNLIFANPGGNSALRAATPDNPRDYPCPNCEAPYKLTKKDVSLGYQCDSCADAIERGGP